MCRSENLEKSKIENQKSKSKIENLENLDNLENSKSKIAVALPALAEHPRLNRNRLLAKETSGSTFFLVALERRR